MTMLVLWSPSGVELYKHITVFELNLEGPLAECKLHRKLAELSRQPRTCFFGRQEVVEPSTRQFPGRAVVTAAILAVPRGTRGSGHYTGSHMKQASLGV